MRSTGFILDAAIRVVAHECHGFSGQLHIRISRSNLIAVGIIVVCKLIVRHQHRHQAEKQSRTITLAGMGNILFCRLGVFVVNACQCRPAGDIDHYQMIEIRPHGGFVFGDTFLVLDPTDGTFATVGCAMIERMNSFDYRAAQRCLRAAGIFRCHLHLLARQGIKRFRKCAGVIEEVRNGYAH